LSSVTALVHTLSIESSVIVLDAQAKKNISTTLFSEVELVNAQLAVSTSSCLVTSTNLDLVDLGVVVSLTTGVVSFFHNIFNNILQDTVL
jgi:hypothetical protein